MYVREAKNREEVWLLDRIEEMGLDDSAFRSRDYVFAIDETTGEKCGFGRIRIHREEEGECCELTSLGVLPAWRRQGVGAHVVERLVETARDQGFERVFSLAGEPEYLAQFGFEPMNVTDLPTSLRDRLAEKRDAVDPDAVPMVVEVDAFTMPSRLRERFKTATASDDEDDEPEESPEDFGIDPESATYKYDTGR